MVATLAGLGALLLGLALLLLPLLATELSRPGDSAWGALVLVLALVLVTSAERLSGSPMLAVISGGLLVGRLSVEVGRGRWLQLTPEERGRLGTGERWRTSLGQARTALVGLLEGIGRQGEALLARWRERGPAKASGKRWVRPEAAAAAPEVIEVSDFAEIDALLQAAPEEAPVADPPAAGALSGGAPSSATPSPAAQAAEMKTTEGRAAEAQALQAQAAEAKTPEAQSPEAQSPEAQALQAQAPEVPSGEGGIAESLASGGPSAVSPAGEEAGGAG
ncbi:MAG: hypothetical protein ACK587_03350 [Cyanobacteriota bacterium]